MEALRLLKKPFIKLEKITDAMTTRKLDELRRELEGISLRSGEMAAYLDMRHGAGCGDQGHRSAVKNLNKAGKTIWMKAFGYNGYHELSF